jgi:hypothetical protein
VGPESARCTGRGSGVSGFRDDVPVASTLDLVFVGCDKVYARLLVTTLKVSVSLMRV